MKKIRAFISTIVLVAIVSVSCAQTANKEANPSASAEPQLRWKYESGG